MAGELGNITTEIAAQANYAAELARDQIIKTLTPYLKVAGIVLLAYAVYLIIKSISNYKQKRRIKRIDKNIKEILEILRKKQQKPKKKKK